jgi:hypothetical protein
LPVQPTAMIIRMSRSRAFSISAIAACSAQNPRLHSVSMHTPVYTLPDAVTTSAATAPDVQSALTEKAARAWQRWQSARLGLLLEPPCRSCTLVYIDRRLAAA